MMEQPSSLAEMNYVNFEQYERLLRTLFTLRKQSLYMIMCNAVIFQLVPWNPGVPRALLRVLRLVSKK